MRMFLHYYTIVFVCFLVLFWDNATATMQGLAKFGYADPAYFFTNASSIAHSCPNATIKMTPLQWSSSELREVRFDSNGITRKLVLGSCPAVVLTQLVGWWHISKHWLRIKNSEKTSLRDNILRDKAIQIMLLPVIYSVVAYSNVIRLMNLFTGSIDLCRVEWGLDFYEKKSYTLSLYESNLAVADFYEAIALYHFTALITHHIKQTFLRERKQLVDEEANRSLNRSRTQAERNVEKNDPVLRVTNVMSTLVMSGVMSFCLTCLLSFLHGLMLVFRIAYGHSKEEDTGAVPSMLSGAGLVASTVAIGFVVNVEVAFHHELGAFKPSLKFWSTKVIVSIAFIQEAALGLLGNESIMGHNHALSDVQIKLLYCSLLSYEVFAVTMLHVFAWPAQVNITSFERKEKGAEYWAEDETPHHVADAAEPLLSVE